MSQDEDPNELPRDSRYNTSADDVPHHVINTDTRSGGEERTSSVLQFGSNAITGPGAIEAAHLLHLKYRRPDLGASFQDDAAFGVSLPDRDEGVSAGVGAQVHAKHDTLAGFHEQHGNNDRNTMPLELHLQGGGEGTAVQTLQDDQAKSATAKSPSTQHLCPNILSKQMFNYISEPRDNKNGIPQNRMNPKTLQLRSAAQSGGERQHQKRDNQNRSPNGWGFPENNAQRDAKPVGEAMGHDFDATQDLPLAFTFPFATKSHAQLNLHLSDEVLGSSPATHGKGMAQGSVTNTAGQPLHAPTSALESSPVSCSRATPHQHGDPGPPEAFPGLPTMRGEQHMGELGDSHLSGAASVTGMDGPITGREIKRRKLDEPEAVHASSVAERAEQLRLRRILRNRESARRSRLKSKSRLQEMERNFAKLKAENDALSHLVDSMLPACVPSMQAGNLNGGSGTKQQDDGDQGQDE